MDKLAGIKSRASAFTHWQLVLKPAYTRSIQMVIDILDLLQAIGEALTETWPDRLVLGTVIGSVIARLAGV